MWCRKIRGKKFTVLFNLLLLVSSSVIGKNTSAQIIEIQKMSEIQKYVDKDTMLIFDLDNTLIAPTGNFGSDAWFDYMWDSYKMDPLNKDTYTLTLQSWARAQDHVKVSPIESTSLSIIDQAKKMGNPVMALTSRNPALKAVTERQLSLAGIQFTPSVGMLNSYQFPAAYQKNFRDDAVFDRGILFVGGNKKGTVLESFFHVAKFLPKKIVYVDDKRGHVENLEQVCKSMNIAYTGFRYGALDEKVKRYTSKVSKLLSAGYPLPVIVKIKNMND